MAQDGRAVDTVDSFLALDTRLPLRLSVLLRGLCVEDTLARYRPDDRITVEPPAP